MPTAFTAIRFASLGLMLILLFAFPERRDYRAFVWSFAFAHYFLALGYGTSTMRAVWNNRGAWPWVAALLAGGALAFSGGVSLALYFGFHHALNESFMLDRVTRQRADPRVRQLRGAGFVYHFALFLAVTDGEAFGRFDPSWLWGVAATGVLYLALLARARPVLSSRELGDHLVPELLVAPLVAWVVLSGNTVSAIDVSIYHFLFWAIYPGVQLWSRPGAGFGPYVAATLGVLGLFVLFSPMGLVEPHFGRTVYRDGFFALSFVHITISVALSDANPDFVNRVFRPKALPRA